MRRLLLVASLVLLAGSFCSAAAAPEPESIEVLVSVDEPVAQLSDWFLSVTMDAEQIPNHWNGLNFSDPRLLPMARALAPAVLRIGGTAQDGLTYVFDDEGETVERHGARTGVTTGPAINMLMSDFDRMSQFANDAGWKIVFGLNALTRNDDGSWDGTQAQRLIARTGSDPTRYPIMAFELSNEPDLFSTAFNVSVTPQELAQSFQSLRGLIDAFAAPGVQLFGCDAANPAPGSYFYQFLGNISAMELETGAARILDMATIHHYYEGASVANMSVATSGDLLDRLGTFFLEVSSGLPATDFRGRPIVMGETSSFFGGGAVGISDRFVAGFNWLDKLSLAATRGWASVFRQTFIGGVVPPFSLHYSLVDQSLRPNPDFFTSVLWKRLVGSGVLVTQQQQNAGIPDQLVRTYAFCTRSTSSDSLPEKYVRPGSVTIVWMSLHTDGVVVDMGLEMGYSAPSGPRLEYTLRPNNTSTDWQTAMAATALTLNGGPALEMNPKDGEMPPMQPNVIPDGAKGPVRLEPLTYGFVVLPDAQAPACGFKQQRQQGKGQAEEEMTEHRRRRHRHSEKQQRV